MHILAKADPKTVGMIGDADHRKGIEIYNHNRYFTLTGNQLNDNPLRDATEQVQQVMREHFPASSADDRVRRQVGAMARSQTRRMANQAMIANAGRDHVRFARVPSGGRTCAFCAMLASRGFVYHTAETAGSMNRYHNDCRCEIVPGFDDDTIIDGYDPDALYEDYARARDEAGDNPSTSDILAAMRRHEGNGLLLPKGGGSRMTSTRTGYCRFGKNTTSPTRSGTGGRKRSGCPIPSTRSTHMKSYSWSDFWHWAIISSGSRGIRAMPRLPTTSVGSSSVSCAS